MSATPIFSPFALNPLIENTTADTLHQVQCCLSFIGRVHADLADWKVISETSEAYGPDDLSSEQHRGMSLLLACVRAAVLHEIERVQS
ncbi:hypothetical protein MX652_16275 [Thauera aromatica]|nr:hypothetical protein [Thauera aromatica]MCK2128228.1 hypothetical protein [Thauera aromatica]